MEHGEPVHGQSSSGNYMPRPIRNRKRTEFIGSGEFYLSFYVHLNNV